MPKKFEFLFHKITCHYEFCNSYQVMLNFILVAPYTVFTADDWIIVYVFIMAINSNRKYYLKKTTVTIM